MNQPSEHNLEIWRRAIVRCWYDEDFRRKLQTDPVTTLNEMGATIEPGTTVHVHENRETTLHLVIPTKDTPLDHVVSIPIECGF